MSLTPAVDPAILHFETAIREFKKNLKDPTLYQEILATTSIDQVYDLADQIQTKQGSTGHLRHLSKIKPYLEKLELYASAIDTFVQVKPDILALIWGPVKLLVQWTSTLSKSQDAIANITAEIGDLLPEFTDMTALFRHNTRLNDVMSLFFQDILDFYLVTLRFFSLSRWRYLFESLWPRQKEKINLVKAHIERHAILMRTEVRLEHIREEHAARQRALNDFEKAERERTFQEFHRIKTGIAPVFYDEKLAWISSTLCDGTGKWLLRNDEFLEWLDPRNTTKGILWLNGIPGAGKTFLAATVIDKCQSLGHRTIYVFLSHVHATSTLAVSVLHSLIFQLASRTEDLQATLCQSSRETLKSNLHSAASLLKSLLDCAGPTFLVVDGVDEIDKKQRELLLAELLKLSAGCDTARILICSRPEDDIKRALGTSPTIRVDQQNSGSIQAFVNRQTSDWIARRDFLPHQKSEIAALLVPVATKAKGMFLYAKVLFGCLDLLSEIGEVRQELKVLPTSLHEAYERILKHVNNLLSVQARSKAKRLLGFVGCSPMPLTVHELDQLLTLDLDDAFGPHLASSSLKPVELCGPIVEIIDGYVHFVHFTVKEYLFSPKIDGSIDETKTTVLLTKSCLEYLCQDHHGIELSADEVEDGIKHGVYRLYAYAESMWFPLVQECLRLDGSIPIPSELLQHLEAFAAHRFASGSHEEGEEKNPISLDFDQFKSRSPIVFALLLRAAEFSRRCESSDFQMTDGNRWKALDPLNTSDLSISIHQGLDALLCGLSTHTNNCCDYLNLRRIYGPCLFKCPYLGCKFRRQGFETRKLQRSHTTQHDRPWKCGVPGCEYAETGFFSRRMRDAHLDQFHTEDQQQQAAPTPDTRTLDKDEIQALVFDLVRADRTREVKQLIGHLEAMSPELQRELLLVVSETGSGAMMELLYNAVVASLRAGARSESQFQWLLPLYSAIQRKNLDVVQWILRNGGTKIRAETIQPRLWKSERGSFLTWSCIVRSVLESDSEDIFQCLLPELVNPLSGARAEVMEPAVVRATARRPDRERRLLLLWDKIRGSCPTRHFSLYLRYVAETCYSIPLAKALLCYGADINSTGKGSATTATTATEKKRYRTPLQCAVKKSSREAAEMARFLLYQGANPGATSILSKLESIGDEIGAKEISKWLGMGWDELVAKVKADRAAGICPAEFA